MKRGITFVKKCDGKMCAFCSSCYWFHQAQWGDVTDYEKTYTCWLKKKAVWKDSSACRDYTPARGSK